MVLHDSKFEYLAYRTASSKLFEELPSLPNGFTTTLHRAKILHQRAVSKI